MKKLDNDEVVYELYELLLYGEKVKVKLKSGNLGCSDVQDAVNDGTELVLFQKDNNYYINTLEDDDNLLCVDMFFYIKMIVDSFKRID